MPPAAWKWLMSALPFGIDVGQGRHDFGKVGHVLPGQLNPGGPAMAGMCKVWLVEPPVACNATMELTSERSSTISPKGMKLPLCRVRRVT
jgi:hypothetical protein